FGIQSSELELHESQFGERRGRYGVGVGIDEYAARLLSDMTTLVEHRALVPPDVLDVLARLRGDVVGRQTGADHRLDVAGAQGIAPRGLGRVGAASAPDGAYDSVVHGQPMLRARRIDEDECVLLIRQS